MKVIKNVEPNLMSTEYFMMYNLIFHPICLWIERIGFKFVLGS